MQFKKKTKNTHTSLTDHHLIVQQNGYTYICLYTRTHKNPLEQIGKTKCNQLLQLLENTQETWQTL